MVPCFSSSQFVPVPPAAGPLRLHPPGHLSVPAARLTGDLPVASNVRFADVRRPAPPAPPAGAAAAAQKAQQLLQGIPGGGVAVQAPRPRTATTAAAVFGVLAAWTLAQGLLEPSPQSAAADVPGVQLALATAATVYLLREEKRMGLGKAIGLALVGLVVGTFVGAAVQSWLRVDIIPLGVSGGAVLVGGQLAGKEPAAAAAGDALRPGPAAGMHRRVQACAASHAAVSRPPAAARAADRRCCAAPQALSSPGILVGEFSIIALAAVCLFLA